MQLEYKHKGYRLVWSCTEGWPDMGSEWIFDSKGILKVHATTNGVPPNEEEAKASIEWVINDLPKVKEMGEEKCNL